MICSVNKHNIDKLVEFCDKDSVFACEIYSSLITYGRNCSWVFGGFDEEGENAFCGVKTVMSGYMVYAPEIDDEQLSSLAEFFVFMPKKDIISNRNVIEGLQKQLGGKIQEKIIMKRAYGSFDNEKLKNLCKEKAVHPDRYYDMFDILTKTFKEDCPKELRDDWLYSISLKERKAGSKGLVIYHPDHPDQSVSCGFLDSVNSYCGIIASIATYEEYRGKGYATKIITSLLSDEEMKDKNAYVVLSNKNLEKFYNQFGFEISGTYCILKY